MPLLASQWQRCIHYFLSRFWKTPLWSISMQVTFYCDSSLTHNFPYPAKNFSLVA